MKKLQIILIASLLQFFLFSVISNAQQPGEIGYTDNSNFPKGKIGEVLQTLITTVNANDADKLKEFIENSCSIDFQNMVPMEAHQEYWSNVYKLTGGFSFHSIRNYNPIRPEITVVIIKDINYNFWRAITITFADEVDYLINDLQYSEARPPSNIKEPKITESDLLIQTKELIDRLCERDVFSGTILIAKEDQILYEEACGEASKRFHVANNLDTKFNLGSMNKMFTSVGIMQLVDKGIIKLDDPISEYVDESWLPAEITNKVTIHHLLTHTSGLGSYFNNTYWKGSRELYRSVEDFKPLVQGDTLISQPGDHFWYSNTGMLLLGVVIQQSTGQDYFEYIRQNIYKPAAMDNSDSYDMDQPVENLAIGYLPSNRNEYGWENNIYKHVIKGGPAGGGFSTVRDLHKFAVALNNKKLVSESALNQLWTDHYHSHYGYGFNVETNTDGKIVGHGGGFPGLNSQLDIFLDKGYIVAVMSNYDSGASPVALKINQLIRGLKN